MARSDLQVNFRMPAELKGRLEQAADANRRSLTAEIVERLDFSLRAHPHALMIRALIDLQQALLEGKEEVELPPHLQDEIAEAAHKRGLSPNKFLIRLVLEALDHMDQRTEVGEALERSILALEDQFEFELPNPD